MVEQQQLEFLNLDGLIRSAQTGQPWEVWFKNDKGTLLVSGPGVDGVVVVDVEGKISQQLLGQLVLLSLAEVPIRWLDLGVKERRYRRLWDTGRIRY
jgi:hypothetical protein